MRPVFDRLWSVRQRLDIIAIAVLLLAGVLRFAHLGYSHFQGDEIQALYPPTAAFPEFLLSQKKGPVQFLVTLVINRVFGGYDEWLTRVPFALASWISVVVMYRLTFEHWGRPTALVAAALVGSCGLLVALGRIVQYQSFCVLFIALTACWMFRAVHHRSLALIYAGFVTYALALLTHYDALAFGPTFGALLGISLWRHRASARTRLPHVAAAGLLATALLALFYAPYMAQPHFSDVSAYLMFRASAGRGLETLTRTHGLLELYLPPFYLPLLAGLTLAGIGLVLWRHRQATSLVLVLWFASVFASYMMLGGDPRSHVYNYFLPGLILAAIGATSIAHLAARGWPRRCAWGVLSSALLASAAVTYYMVVDHSREHPWYAKTVLGYPLPNLEDRRAEGVMGFPYQRGLDQVGQLFDSGQLRGSFDSNEREYMANYYFHSRRSDLPDYYIYVHRTLSLARELPPWVAESFRLKRSVFVDGRPTIDVYERQRRD